MSDKELLPDTKAERIKTSGIWCGWISPQRWASAKQCPIPWTYVDAFNPFEESEQIAGVPIRFFKCRASSNCKQVWEVKEKGANLQSNMVKHIKTHFSFNPGLLDFSSAESATTTSFSKKPKPTAYEWVARWLASGLAHYQVTRNTTSGLYHFLKDRTDTPVCSQETFDKHRDTFLGRTTENMIKHLEGNVGFILGDSTPDPLKREWINFVTTFIDEKDVFYCMPLGLNSARGRLDEASYRFHHDTLIGAWSFTTGKRDLTNSMYRLVGGGSDMGPGLRQVYGSLFGEPNLKPLGQEILESTDLVMYGPCTAHAVTNIIKATLSLEDATGEEESPKDYVEELVSLLGLLKRRVDLESIRAATGIPFPSTFRSNRWTSLKRMMGYFLDNWVSLLSLVGTNLDITTQDCDHDIRFESDEEDQEDTGQTTIRQLWNWDSTFDMLSVFSAVMEPLNTLALTLQKVGPLDGYVMVINVLNALHALHTNDFQIAKLVRDDECVILEGGEPVVDESETKKAIVMGKLYEQDLSDEQKSTFQKLEGAIDLMKQRIVRRFFFNSLGSSIGRSAGGSDRTFKFDYLQCTTILVLFALSPDSDFHFLKHYGGIASDEEIASLERRAKDALWLFYKNEFEIATLRTVTAVSTTSTKRLRPDLMRENTDSRSEEDARRAFFVNVSTLQAHPDLREATNRFFASNDTKDDRDTLLKTWLKLARSIDDRIYHLLRIAAAQCFANAVGECNFSSITRFLSSQRLKSGGKLLAAQLLGCRAIPWRQMDDPEKGRQARGKVKDVEFGQTRLMFSQKANVASLSFGSVTPIEKIEEDEEDNEDTAVEHDQGGDEEERLNGEESIARSTTRPARANRSALMSAVIRNLYTQSNGTLYSGVERVELGEEDDSDWEGD